MGNFKLSLPTDIPWRRICVANDMLDAITCDDERPPRWHSSLVAFRYDPAEEYQPYENEVVSYIKVVATVAPYQDEEIGAAPKPGFVPQEIIEEVSESHPCYGAVLQVGVGPTKAEEKNFTKSHYPYFIDFEPKKRELYEAVSDTGEVLSGSRSNLSVGKAATNSYGVEDYNLDMGGGGSASLFWGLASGSWSGQQQTGTVTRSNNEVSNVRTTDFSTERREVQSHTTQLTQMYNLFQAFHLGTNRAVFFIEPHPHIRQTEATFINGPRALEGIQEVFLIVVRPKTMQDFCISALLETAHITFEEEEEPKTDTAFREINAHGQVVIDESGKHQESDFYHVTYEPPPGWIIDKSAGSGGYDFTVYKKTKASLPTPIVTKQKFTASGEVGVGATLHIGITIYIKSEAGTVHYVRKLFMTARQLCCCPPARALPRQWLTYEADFSRNRWQAESGLMSQRAFVQSRQIAAAVRKEMLRSFTSPTRYKHGQVRYTESDTFLTRVADVLKFSRWKRRFDARLSEAGQISDETRGKLVRAFGNVTLGEALTTDANTLARALEIDVAEAGKLKRTLLTEITKTTNATEY